MEFRLIQQNPDPYKPNTKDLRKIQRERALQGTETKSGQNFSNLRLLGQQKGKIVLWQWKKFVGFGSASVTSAKLMLTEADIVQDGFQVREMGEIKMVLGLLCSSLFF